MEYKYSSYELVNQCRTYDMRHTYYICRKRHVFVTHTHTLSRKLLFAQGNIIKIIRAHGYQIKENIRSFIPLSEPVCVCSKTQQSYRLV